MWSNLLKALFVKFVMIFIVTSFAFIAITVAYGVYWAALWVQVRFGWPITMGFLGGAGLVICMIVVPQIPDEWTKLTVLPPKKAKRP